MYIVLTKDFTFAPANSPLLPITLNAGTRIKLKHWNTMSGGDANFDLRDNGVFVKNYSIGGTWYEFTIPLDGMTEKSISNCRTYYSTNCVNQHWTLG